MRRSARLRRSDVGLTNAFEQEQHADSKAALVDFKPSQALGKMDSLSLHMLLHLVAKHAPQQLQRPSIPHLKALLKAYTETDEGLAELRLSGAKAEDKPRLAESLAELILGSQGFKRYCAAAFTA